MTDLLAFVGPFSPVESCNPSLSAAMWPAQPAGPSSNTGQKSPAAPPSLSAPLIDFCTLVFDDDKAVKLFKRMPATEIVAYVFGTAGRIVAGPLTDRLWNFRYDRSAILIDEAAAVCGRVGISKDGEVCVSITGHGCQHVTSWAHVHRVATDLRAHLTRLDIAVDDFDGEFFDVNHFRDLYHSGAFVMNGRPPKARFISDEGSQSGCSLYIGQKGHKELNVYEKGKQLGDPESAYTRCELRLYAKRIDLPLDALIHPGKYFGGAYPALAELIIGELDRLQVKERMVEPSAKAMVEVITTQCGTGLRSLWQAAVRMRGKDYAMRIIEDYLIRDGVPGRFKHLTPQQLEPLLQNQLDSLFPDAA